MPHPSPATALPEVPGWPRQRIDQRLPSPASRHDADRARFWVDLDPPLDPTGLPTVIQTDRPGQARRTGRRILWASAAAVLLIGLGYATVWDDAPWEEVLLGMAGPPGLVASLGAALLWTVRGYPDRLRLELSGNRVRCGTPPMQWEEALSAYAGLALRRRLISDPTRKRRGGFSAGERAAGMHLRKERWWIELVHEDPARTVVLWATEEPLDDGLERVDDLAAALGLPVLTTSNRYWVADDGLEPETPMGRAASLRTEPSSSSSMPRGAGLQTAAARHTDAATLGPRTPAGSGHLVPGLIALCVMLPGAAGLGWLTWTVAQETRTVMQSWQPVEVTVLDKSGVDTVRLAIVDAAGQRRESDVARTTDLKAFASGESFAAYADPAHPDVLRPASAASLWAGVGMLAFFTLVFAAVGGFLLRASIPRRQA